MMTKERTDYPDLSVQVRQLSDTALACRDLRHAWAVDVPFYRQKVKGEKRGVMHVYREVGCLRCGTIRKEVYRLTETTLDRISTSYSYPEDYLLHGVSRKDNVMQMVRMQQIHNNLRNAPLPPRE